VNIYYYLVCLINQQAICFSFSCLPGLGPSSA